MKPFFQCEPSSGPSVHPEKRRRGRPRKDPSLKITEAARLRPGFENIAKKLSREGDGPHSVVGQPVAGFVEASFDAGYLLVVRIGNSTTYLRGVVFKTEAFSPVTAENDIAPHLQMISRDDVSFPAENRSWSRRPKLAIVKAGPKRGPTAPHPAAFASSVDIRGNVVPVTLQTVDMPNRDEATPVNQPAHLLSFGDKDVHMVEPLSTVPPDQANQRVLGAHLPASHQVPQQNEGGSTKVEPTESTEGDDMTSSESSEELKSCGEEDSGTDAKQEHNELYSSEPTQTAPTSNFTIPLPVANPLFSFGTGRMTELLQAVQEKPMQMTEQLIPPNSKADFNNMGTSSHPDS